MNKLKKFSSATGVFLLAVIALIIVGSTINNRLGNSKVEGHIEGLGTTIALVSGGSNSFNESFFKLIIVWDGHFSFKAGLDEAGGGKILARKFYFDLPDGSSMWMRSRIISFHLNPKEQLYIKGTLKPLSIDYVVTGNLLSEQNNLFRQQSLPLLEEEAQAALWVKKLQHEGAGPVALKAARFKLDSLQLAYKKEKLVFALTHPTLELAANFMQVQEKEDIIAYFPTLADHVKQTDDGLLLQERIKAWGKLVIGMPAPTFNSKGLDGMPFNLTTHKGKYVVLDFWGSWCGPCISGIPRMKSYHSKYGKQVEFVSIACRDSEEVWRKTVAKQALPWTQLLNREKDKLDIIYSVEDYPTKVLIDPNGNLLGLFVGESDAFYQKLDELFGKQVVAI